MSEKKEGPGVTVITEGPDVNSPDFRRPYEFVMETDVESLEKMHKVGRHRKFEIHVDEPAHLKGDDNYPQMVVKPVPLVSKIKINGEAFEL